MMRRRVLFMVVLCAVLVACSGSGGDGDGRIRLPPAWTPTAIALPGVPSEGSWVPCDNAPPSQLQLGDKAVLDEGIEFEIRIRSEPGLSGTITSTVSTNDILEISGGPACYDHLVWWEVRSLGTGASGWTAEGNSFGPWILKVE